MPKQTGIKSLGAFVPRVDPTLRARLASNGTPEAVKASVTGRAVTTAPDSVHPQVPKSPNSETRQPGPPVSIRVELYLELIDDPRKCCPTFAYVRRDDPPEVQRIVIVLNRGLWPTTAALARVDHNALRWLAALAVLDRCLTWPTHPILRALSRHLCQAALGENGQDYQTGLWAAYKLKDHRLFALDPSMLQGKTEQAPQKFTEFNVEVDAARLASWRANFAAKRKPRQSA